MEKVMARQIVVESGKDHTNRPMIAVYGCYFPDPAHVNYDLLLEDCLDRFEAYANMDYVVIFFAAPMEHEPKLSWMIKAYKSLSRKYKKNIKKLYVTHPSFWFKILVWFMSKIQSNKFAAKIEPVKDLEQLGKFIPIDKVFIPPVVTGHDKGLPPVPEGQNKAILPSVKIFGAEVERAAPAGEVPAQIERVIKALEKAGIKEEGIFRLSPDVIQMEQIRLSMDRDYDIDLDQFSPHALAAALKAYFRQIPTPLIPPSTYESFKGIFEISDDDERVKYIRRIIFREMSSQRVKLLALVIKLLRKTANYSDENKMRPRNLAAVWTPNLVRCESLQDELKMLATSQKVIEVMIDLSDALFGINEESAEGDTED